MVLSLSKASLGLLDVHSCQLITVRPPRFFGCAGEFFKGALGLIEVAGEREGQRVVQHGVTHVGRRVFHRRVALFHLLSVSVLGSLAHLTK